MGFNLAFKRLSLYVTATRLDPLRVIFRKYIWYSLTASSTKWVTRSTIHISVCSVYRNNRVTHNVGLSCHKQSYTSHQTATSDMKQKRDTDILFYSFFWVIPRRLNFIRRRFGQLCSIFVVGVSRKNNRDEIFRALIFCLRSLTILMHLNRLMRRINYLSDKKEECIWLLNRGIF